MKKTKILRQDEKEGKMTTRQFLMKMHCIDLTFYLTQYKNLSLSKK